MELTPLPLPPDIWAATPSAAQALILAQGARIRELEAQLGQNSANSSRPPPSDPPQAPARPKAPPSGRKRGGQPGHRGAFRRLLPVEQVDAVVRKPVPASVAAGALLGTLAVLLAAIWATSWFVSLKFT